MTGVTAQVENTRLARKFLVGLLKMTVHNMMYRYSYLRLSKYTVRGSLALQYSKWMMSDVLHL